MGYLVHAVVTSLALAVGVAGCCKQKKSSREEAPIIPVPTATTASTLAPSGDRVFTMDVPCDNTPDLRIKEIAMTSTETRVTLRYHNTSTRSMSISTSPPGKADTFFIEAADQTRRYALLRSSGIAISPMRDTVRAGATVQFTLYFPPIDFTWSPIDLHEGEIMKKGVNYWNFHGVHLR
jgi:hypothetical protein